MKPVYLDNNATTMSAPEVVAEMLPYLSEFYGNPSSMHSFGGRVGLRLKQARSDIAGTLGCQPDEIIFNSCGSEGDNTAILSALAAQPDKRHIVTTRVEHPAVLSLARHLEEKGYEVTYLGVDEKGRLDMAELGQAIRKDTAIVSIMYANNETGVIFPLPEIAALCKARGVLLHTDAVQAVGKIDIDLAKLPVSMLSLSGHKLHAPKGVGVLYVRKGTPFRPFLIGGHQERGRRAGTENAAGIIALAKAMTLAKEHMVAENTQVKALRDRLEAGILAAIPHSLVNGDTEHRLPNTSSIAFKFVEGEAILLMLDQYGICASSGSACTSGSLEPSHVLRAMGVPFTYAHGSIRFSLSRYTTDAEIDLVLEKLPGIIETLRRMSPFRDEEAAKPACTC
ncbi:cysteine desulfurase NifS [Desulfovibrio aerotolerans]|uniref:Cysteine desulfurase n=1 Tax=Solidesulfovibrio aerotolerans TaxID=295255 RepID=A0A7C9IVR3_9BACT|nr:cysteine desulfurase NifS [Solidesulfovibrio aerotolerans]MYL85140.1 cysteine desulfurase NifS [Solidesulfovibrio aerotolerans]